MARVLTQLERPASVAAGVCVRDHRLGLTRARGRRRPGRRILLGYSRRVL